jgi:hypothetical protein
MDRLHEMLPEDEVFMCGLVLLIGIGVGVVTRWLAALTERRAS